MNENYYELKKIHHLEGECVLYRRDGHLFRWEEVDGLSKVYAFDENNKYWDFCVKFPSKIFKNINEFHTYMMKMYNKY